LGGKPTPAVGFAAGVERLILALGEMESIVSTPDIYFITLGKDANVQASRITHDLRKECGKIVIMETLRRSIKAQMRDANRQGAKMVFILGDDELKKNIVMIKNMFTGSQEEISIQNIIQYVSKDL